jgi:alpha-beta hydrolase superfamily lysophospholipase
MRTIAKLITLSVLFLVLFLVSTSFSVFAKTLRYEDSSVGQKLNLPVYQWVNSDSPQRAVIVAVHGLTFYAAAFDEVATHFADRGYTFYAADLRGFGRWKDEAQRFHGDSKIHFTESQLDLLRVLKAVREENPNEKIFCFGESLGANYALWVAANNPGLIDGVIAGSPCFKACVHPRLRWGVDFFKGLLHPKTPLNLEPYITPYLSDDKAVTRSCLKDKRICRKLSPEDLIKTSKTNKWTLANVKNIPADMPILIVAGQKDKVFKARSLKKFVPLLGSKQVECRVLKGRGHLLFEHQPVHPEIVGIVDNWLDQRVRNSATVVTIP